MYLRSKWTQFKEKLIGDTDPSAIMNDLIRTVVRARPCCVRSHCGRYHRPMTPALCHAMPCHFASCAGSLATCQRQRGCSI